jgi:hypothetical protein
VTGHPWGDRPPSVLQALGTLGWDFPGSAGGIESDVWGRSPAFDSENIT